MVVYGHSSADGWGIGKWIYSFHMPLFFILSGYLYGVQKPRKGTRFPTQKISYLLRNYLSFALIGYAYWFLVQRRFGVNDELLISPWVPIFATFYGTGTPSEFTVIPRFLWFLPCLAVANVLLFLVNRIPHGLGRWLALGTCGWAGFLVLAAFPLPLEIETALIAVIFMYIGQELHRKNFIQKIPAGIVVVLLMIGTACAATNSGVDMRASIFGSVILFAGSSLFLSVALLALSRHMPSFKIVHAVSENSINILGLHSLVFSLFRAFYTQVFNFPSETIKNPFVGILETLLIMGALVLASPWITKIFPWTVRESSKQTTAAHHP